MDSMTKQKYVYLVFPANGKSATEHQANAAVVEESGVLALYASDEAGNNNLIHAFNANAWREVQRKHPVENA
jgi:hypothetical protein